MMNFVKTDGGRKAAGDRVDVRSQSGVQLEEIPLIAEDAEALEALRILHEKGYTSDEVKQAYAEITLDFVVEKGEELK